MHQEDAALPELRECLVFQALRHALGDTGGPADDVRTRYLRALVELGEDAGSVPPGVREHTGVLRAEDEDDVKGDDKLRMRHGAQCSSQRVGQRLGCA